MCANARRRTRRSSVAVRDRDRERLAPVHERERQPRAGGLDEHCRANNLEPATYVHYRVVLSKIFKLGVRSRKVAANPVPEVASRRINNDRVRWLNQFDPLPTGDPELDSFETEEGRLRAAIGRLCPYREPEFDLALATGMRWSEQYGLRWVDVDLTAGVLTLRQTKAGERQHVRLSPAARAALMWLAELNPKKTSPFVCLHDRRRWRNDWDAVRAAAKLDEPTRGKVECFHWHDLRHTFASRLVMAGVDILTVRELMRHKKLEMTLRYAHLAPQHVDEALERLDAANAKCKESVMEPVLVN